MHCHFSNKYVWLLVKHFYAILFFHFLDQCNSSSSSAAAVFNQRKKLRFFSFKKKSYFKDIVSMLDGEKLSSQNHINFFCFLSWNYITFNKKKHKYEIDFQKKKLFWAILFWKRSKIYPIHLLLRICSLNFWGLVK